MLIHITVKLKCVLNAHPEMRGITRHASSYVLHTRANMLRLSNLQLCYMLIEFTEMYQGFFQESTAGRMPAAIGLGLIKK